MGTNCAALIADLFLFCHERDFMTSLSDVKQAVIIEAFNSISGWPFKYWQSLLWRHGQSNLSTWTAVKQSDTETPFLDLHLSISNGFVSSKIFDTRDDFDFGIVNFQFWDVDVPRSTSYGVDISKLMRFARVSSHVADFSARK